MVFVCGFLCRSISAAFSVSLSLRLGLLFLSVSFAAPFSAFTGLCSCVWEYLSLALAFCPSSCLLFRLRGYLGFCLRHFSVYVIHFPILDVLFHPISFSLSAKACFNVIYTLKKSKKWRLVDSNWSELIRISAISRCVLIPANKLILGPRLRSIKRGNSTYQKRNGFPHHTKNLFHTFLILSLPPFFLSLAARVSRD